MTMNEDFTRGFFNTLLILRSYLSEIVITGGWAPFLYYRYLVGNRNHDAEGPLRIVEQRPAGAFPGLDDEQLKHHAFGTFEQFTLGRQARIH